MRWLATAAFAVSGCTNGILVCPGMGSGSGWICPGGTPNACALPPLLCSTTELVEACQVKGVFQPDFTSCDYNGNGSGTGRCTSGACEICTNELDGCAAPGWTAMTSGTSQDLHGIYAVSSREAYAVGAMGTFLRYDGTSWQPLPADPDASTLLAIAPDGTGGFFVVNFDPAVYAVDGAGTWSTAVTTKLGLRAIAATGPTVTAVGNLGAIYQFDGTAWVDQSAPQGVNAPWFGVWGSGDTRFAAGAAGVVVTETGSAEWTVSRGSGAGQLELTAVTGTGSDDVYAVSISASDGSAQVVHYDGNNWTTEASGLSTGTNLDSVWAASPSAIFAGGQHALIQCDGLGCTWDKPGLSPARLDLPADVFGMAGVDRTHGFAVGAGGAILRYGGPGSAGDDTD